MDAVNPTHPDYIEMGEFAAWVMTNVVERLPDENVVTLNKMMCLALIARKNSSDPEKEEATGEQRIEDIFETFDLNDDGVLSISEISSVLGGSIARDFLASLASIEKVPQFHTPCSSCRSLKQTPLVLFRMGLYQGRPLRSGRWNQKAAFGKWMTSW
jgi:hypothetical protein